MAPAMTLSSVATAGDAIGARAARHMDTAFRAIMRPPAAEHRREYMRFITGEMHPLGNAAIVLTPDDAAVARAAAAPLLESGLPSAVIFIDRVSDEATRTVEALGFSCGGAMPAMAVDIEALADTALPPGYGWSRVGEGAPARDWTVALADGYEIPQGLARAFSPESLGADMADDAAVQFFAVTKDGRAVATSLFFLADGLAGIYCVSTLPAERHRGLAAHATAQALREARRLGYRVGVLQSSAAGHSVYLRLGFSDVATMPLFVRMPGQ